MAETGLTYAGVKKRGNGCAGKGEAKEKPGKYRDFARETEMYPSGV